MLVQAAAVFVRFATLLALQITGSSFLFLAQVSAIAGSPHLEFRLVHARERRQRRTVNDGTGAVRSHHFRGGDMLWKAAGHEGESIIERSQRRSRGRSPSIGGYRSIGRNGFGDRCEIGTLPTADTVCGTDGTERRGVGVGTAGRSGSNRETGRTGGRGQAVLAVGP